MEFSGCDTKSKKLGDDFRDALFAAQPTIHSQDDLQNFAQKFAQDHKLAFPFVADPQGKLAQLVKADSDLGQSVGIQHTPTIWVVTNQTSGSPFVEVIDRARLDSLIEDAQAATAARTK
jgi:protein-disulfide isomerase